MVYHQHEAKQLNSMLIVNENQNLRKTKFAVLLFSVNPEISVENDVIGSFIGLSMELKCLVEAFPTPIIYWSTPLGMKILNCKNICQTKNIITSTGNVITNNENMSTKQMKLSNFLFSSYLLRLLGKRC